LNGVPRFELAAELAEPPIPTVAHACRPDTNGASTLFVGFVAT
jgi:hypothetical protein